MSLTEFLLLYKPLKCSHYETHECYECGYKRILEYIKQELQTEKDSN